MRIIALLFCLLMITGHAFATDSLPDDLIVDGKPISPECFGVGGMERKESFPVRCERNSDLKITDGGLFVDENGEVSLTYEDTESGSFAGYDTYRYIGPYRDGHLVQHIFSGGGSGRFSTSYIVKREGDILQIIDSLGGGDRCNGGYLEVVLEDGQLHETRSITPYDFIMFERSSMSHPYAKAYEEIDACAMCCLGRIHMVDHVIQGFEIDKEYSNRSYNKTGKEHPKQICFDDLINLRIVHDDTSLDREGIHAFVREIEHVCLGRAEGEE